MNKDSKTVFIMIPPEFGHVNPMSCIASEVVKHNIRVIFYGNEEQREIVNKTGAEFRLYEHRNFGTFEKQELHEDKRDIRFETFDSLLKFAYALLPGFIRDVQTDQPDAIINDQLFLPAKYLIKVLNRRSDLVKKPLSIEFAPNMIFNEQIIKELPAEQETIWMKLNNILLLLKQMVFNVYYGVWVLHPMQLWFEPNPNLTILSVMNELQPKRDTFDQRYKFVGPCISEKVRNYQVTDQKIKQILDMFKPRERFDSTVEPNDSLKLVYVSLGTTFSHNSRIYEKIIDGFRHLNDDRLKLDKLRVVISLGKMSFEKIGKKIKEGNFELPNNCFIFESVPQIEMLKRASLFVSHCGQNSVSETIQYGVPIVAVPLIWDQLILARLLGEEYKAGVQLSTMTFEPKDLSNAIVDTLTDSKYKENILKLSKSAQSLNGSKTAAQIIVDFIDQNAHYDKKNN